MELTGLMVIVTKWLPILAGVISVASLIAAITPSKSDDRVLQIILDVVNKLGLNIGKAKNEDDK